MNHDEIERLVLAKVVELTSDSGTTNSESRLVGRDAVLTSIQLVNLIVDLENELSELGYEIELASEQAMSSSKSPFRSVGNLVQHIQELIGE